MSKRLKQFHASAACDSHFACGSCRDKDGGRGFRATVAEADEVDFPCPKTRGGKPWGFVPPAWSAAVAVTVRGKPCNGCGGDKPAVFERITA